MVNDLADVFRWMHYRFDLWSNITRIHRQILLWIGHLSYSRMLNVCVTYCIVETDIHYAMTL